MEYVARSVPELMLVRPAQASVVQQYYEALVENGRCETVYQGENDLLGALGLCLACEVMNSVKIRTPGYL